MGQGETGEHLRGAAGATWKYWRWFILRSAGFPLSLLDSLRLDAEALHVNDLFERESACELARQRCLALLHAREAEVPIEDHRLRSKIERAVSQSRPVDEDRLLALGERPESAAVLEATRSWMDQCAVLTNHRQQFDARLAVEMERVQAALRGCLADDRTRQAIAWESTSALEGIDALRGKPLARSSKTRQRELTAMLYLQRFCAKNDTIGFFGPALVGVTSDTDEVVRCQPGAALVNRSEVFFEHWPIVRVAHAIRRDPEALPWLRPLRSARSFVDGTTLHHPVGRTSGLPVNVARLLLLADGSRSFDALATELVDGTEDGFSDRDDLEATLIELEERSLVDATPVVPVCALRPDRALGDEVARLFPEPIRGRWQALLGVLEAARSTVDAATTTEALCAARLALDQRFEELTGESAHRNPGKVYGARDIAYSDSRRDATITLGARFLERLRPLELVYATLREYSARLWALFAPAFVALYDRMAADGRVDFIAFVTQSRETFFTADACAQVEQELHAAWSSAVGVPEGASRVERSYGDMAAALTSLFTHDRPGWKSARHHSPDIMIAADGPEALARGEFLVVLGEVHHSTNTVLYPLFLKLEEGAIEACSAAHIDDLGPIVRTAPGAAMMNRATHYMPDVEGVTFVDTGWPPANSLPSRRVAIGELEIFAQGGTLFVGTVDRRFTAPMRDAFETYLTVLPGADSFRVVKGKHSPRITIDGVVIARESWRVQGPKEIGTGVEAYLATRRWANTLGLPLRFFVKSPTEAKPFYVDLDNPFLVEAFGKIAEKAERLTLSEMMPTAEQLWLCDENGARYTCELRMCAVDPTRASNGME